MLIDPNELEDWWEKHWKDMPEFSQEDLTPVQSIIVHFYTKEDAQDFAELVGSRITSKTKFKKNKLKLKPGLEIPEGINEYGLVLKRVEV